MNRKERTNPVTTAVPVPPDRRPWSVDWPDYRPVDITPPELRPDRILSQVGWAELATSPTGLDWPRRQAGALIPYEVVDGAPRNPHGRTGRTGRNLGLWGENAAADPIVITRLGARWSVLLIRREDCGQWAIPGGMVEPGETAPAALVRELREETGINLGTLDPEVLDRTYVDDPRNTDQAWVCSTVALYRVGRQLDLTAGDDATVARWWPFHSIASLHSALQSADAELYPAHERLLSLALLRLHGDISSAPGLDPVDLWALTDIAVHPDTTTGGLTVYGWCVPCGTAAPGKANFARGSHHLAALVAGAREHFASDQHRDPRAYAEGLRDQAAGTVDTTRTADRAYVAGLRDQRTADNDAALARGVTP